MEGKGNFCLLCFTLADFENFVRIGDLQYIVQKCLPELGSNVIDSGSVCLSCLEDLQDYFDFVVSCFNAEEKINEYVEIEDATQVVLSDVVQYMMKTEGGEHLNNEESTIKEDTEERFAVGPNNYGMVNESRAETMPYYLVLYKVPKIYKAPEEIKMHKCESCGYETKRKWLLKEHSLVHKKVEELEMHKCESCSYETKWKRQLKKHSVVHKKLQEVKMHKCDSCSYEAKRKGQVNKHRLIHKSSEEIEMYKCESCSYETKWKEYLKKHSLIHKNPEEIEMFKCESCEYQAKKKYQLKEHSIVHKKPQEVEMHKCDSCGYETRKKRLLQQHSIVHKKPQEIEMHKCDLCGYETKWKAYLKKHSLIHKNSEEIEVSKKKTIKRVQYSSQKTRRGLSVIRVVLKQSEKGN